MLIDTISKFGFQENIIQNDNGIIMAFDNMRSKWLSISRNYIEFYINRDILYNQWMIYNTWSNLQEYDINRNITITLISVKIKNNSNCVFKIITNDSIIYSIELNNESKKIIDNLDINVDTNDSIKVLLEVHERTNYPVLRIEYAWR